MWLGVDWLARVERAAIAISRSEGPMAPSVLRYPSSKAVPSAVSMAPGLLSVSDSDAMSRKSNLKSSSNASRERSGSGASWGASVSGPD